MSHSLRTIPAGALAACAVVLLTAPQAGAAAGRAGRPDATAPRPAVSARAHPPGHGERGRPALRPPHGWGEARARHRHGDLDAGDADGRPSRDEEGGTAPARRPHGVPGKSPAPSGAPHASAERDADADTSAHGAGAEGTHAAGGPVWPAPVAPPADPLIDSEVWRPAGTAPGQALDGTHARAVGPPASSAAAAPVLPVLTFGAGLTSLGLGIAFFALRLRRG